MTNSIMIVLRKINSVFLGIKKLLDHFSCDEREFRKIWPSISSIEGFLVSPEHERWLFNAARRLPEHAIIVEIGSFKGRSTCCLAYGCKGGNKRVYAVDTFEGNDVDFNRRGYFEEFRNNVKACDLTDYVTPIRGMSSEIAKKWDKPIHMLFIDGSHQYEDVLADFYGFFPHVVSGGIVAVHDVVQTWPGPLRAWNERIKNHLQGIGYCSSLAYGVKQ